MLDNHIVSNIHNNVINSDVISSLILIGFVKMQLVKPGSVYILNEYNEWQMLLVNTLWVNDL